MKARVSGSPRALAQFHIKRKMRYSNFTKQQRKAWNNAPVRVRTPEYKAQKTKGAKLAGRITLKQYELLVAKGFDGEEIKAWTAEHASKEISKVLKRKTPPPAPKSNVPNGTDRMISEGWLG